jgi:hypothetical protein
MKTIALAVLLMTASHAHATGVCENTSAHYDPPELFDEGTQSFAIPALQPWCEEVQSGGAIDEKRGSVSFVELRDVHDKVLGILSTATGDDAGHLKAAVGAFEAVPLGKLHSTLLKRGYVPVVSKAKGCKLTTVWTDVGKSGGWRGATLQLDLENAGKRLLRMKLGTGSIARRGDQIVRGHVIAKQPAIAIFAIVPACAGPPPGYFGPDDTGDCYQVDTPVVMMIYRVPRREVDTSRNWKSPWDRVREQRL